MLDEIASHCSGSDTGYKKTIKSDCFRVLYTLFFYFEHLFVSSEINLLSFITSSNANCSDLNKSW